MKYILLTIGTLFANIASANELSRLRLDLNIGSYHGDRCYEGCSKQYNEFNLGVGMSYELHPNVDILGGSLINSFDVTSTYFGINVNANTKILNIVVEPGMFIGGATGYEDKINEYALITRTISGAVLPNVSFTVPSGFQFNIGYIPEGLAGKSHVITFRVGQYFK